MAEETFNLERAEKLLPQLEPLLQTGIEARQKLAEIEQEYAQLVKGIFLMGGRAVDVAHFSQRKQEKEEWEGRLRKVLQQIEGYGCLLKDLDIGLVDFPCNVGDREVYLCWKLGEPAIRFWHGTDEGFAWRKPIDEEFLAQIKPPRLI